MLKRIQRTLLTWQTLLSAGALVSWLELHLLSIEPIS